MKKRFSYFLLFSVLSFSFFAQSNGLLNEENSIRIKTIVKKWSEAHEEWDLKTLKDLYADTLVFYTQTLKEDLVLAKISNMFRPDEVFKHKIVSEIKLSSAGNNVVLCEFTKEVFTKGKTKSYPSYLVIKYIKNMFYIIAESDYVTDKNLNYKYRSPTSNEKTASLKDSPSKTGEVSSLIYWFTGIIVLFILGTFIYKSRLKTVHQDAPLNQSNVNELKKEITPEKVSPVTKSVLDDDDSIKKGLNFESYVAGKFNRTYFKLIDWRSDKGVGEHYPESNKYPDLEWEFRWNGYVQKFAIECKYRSNPNLDQYEICRADQLENYRKFEKRTGMQVYIALGIGGHPLSPREMYLIPLPKIYSTTMYRSKLKSFYKRIDQDFFFNRDIHSLT